jgi:outer membrane protein OmpA-like peptidoglycan-associated protein
MKTLTTALLTACLLLPAAASLAGSHQEHQLRFLEDSSWDERKEQDRMGKLFFRLLAQQVRESGEAATLADLPEPWRDAVRSDGEHAEAHARLLELESTLTSMGAAKRKLNGKLLAHAEVDLFHVRHELSESIYHADSALPYLEHAAQDIGRMREPDSDGDGITDDRDQCPREPEDRDGFKDRDGCPDPDNDLDGIPDVRDRCPNKPETVNGFQDQDGCPDELKLDSVLFASDSARLDADAIDALAEVAAALDTSPKMRLRVAGHADSANSSKYNLELGKRRAKAVRAYLVDVLEVDGDRLKLASFGEDRPVADNSTSAGRSVNRRVSFTVLH